jgi:hypothetical protein
LDSLVALVLTLWPLSGSKYLIRRRIRPSRKETVICIGFSQAHSSTGNVMPLTRISPVGYLLILSNVEVINFLQNNVM